jgi:drug/metabolite transporter (DMT)-like permease
MLIIGTLLSWASVPLFLRLFKEWGIDPYTANGWRYGISALFWLPVLVWAQRAGKLPKALIVAAGVPVCFNVLGQTAFAWGPTLLEPGFFSFVFRVQIIFATLGAYFLFPTERATLQSKRYWIGAGLIVLGACGLFVFRDPGSSIAGSTPIDDRTFWLGVGVALASGVLFAGYGLAVRKCVGGYSPVLAFGVICQFTAIAMVAIMLVLGHGHGLERADGSSIATLSSYQWFMLAASSFIGIAISHVMYYSSLQRLGVALTVGVIQLQPILTAGGSAIAFGERLTMWQWIGGVVGVCGAVLILWPRKK